MASKKKETGPTIEVEISGETLVLKSPDQKVWDRYISHRRRGELSAGRRELVACCTTSHEGGEVLELLKKKPALPKKIADALEDLAGAGADYDIGDDSATCTADDGTEITIRAPSLEEWEALESDEIAPADFSVKVREAITKLCTEPAAGAFERFPALPIVLLDAAAQLAGAGVQVVVKKG